MVRRVTRFHREGNVQVELEALLVVQRDDEGIRELEQQLQALTPRRASLEQARKRVADEVVRSESTLARETERYRALESRIAEHRARHEKNIAVLNQAHKLREATAAAQQVEAARRVLAEEESELLALSRRMTDLQNAARLANEAVGQLQATQREEREALDAEQQAIESQLAEARAQRAASSQHVSASLLSKYERIYRNRRRQVVFALRNYSCGACDTAIPLQRRPAMHQRRQIEVCEGCGVLLYYEEESVSKSPSATA